jgi:hypothetical protein
MSQMQSGFNTTQPGGGLGGLGSITQSASAVDSGVHIIPAMTDSFSTESTRRVCMAVIPIFGVE